VAGAVVEGSSGTLLGFTYIGDGGLSITYGYSGGAGTGGG
jgi:hypothetical protein